MNRKPDSGFTLFRPKTSGFTLTELMVIIALAGLFLLIILASLSKVRANARDARRYADLTQIQLALEAYYNLNYAYPSTGGQWWSWCTNGADPTVRDLYGANGYIPNLAPAYIAQLPIDPRATSASTCTGGAVKGYIYNSDGVDYKIAADWTAEPGKECNTDKAFDDAARGDGFCSLSTPGAKNW